MQDHGWNIRRRKMTEHVENYESYIAKHKRSSSWIALAVIALTPLLAGCRDEEPFGHNAMDNLTPQFKNYLKNEKAQRNDARFTLKRYVEFEKEHAADVLPQFKAAKRNQRADIDRLKLTWKRFVKAQ